MIEKLKLTILITLLLGAVVSIFVKSYLLSKEQEKSAQKVEEKLSFKYSTMFYARSIAFSIFDKTKSNSLKYLILQYKKNKNKNSEVAIQALFAAKWALNNSQDLSQSEKKVESYINKELKSFGYKFDSEVSKVQRKYFPFFSSIFLFLWISSVIIFIFKGLKRNLELNLKNAKIWGNLSFLFFFIWILTVKFA